MSLCIRDWIFRPSDLFWVNTQRYRYLLLRYHNGLHVLCSFYQMFDVCLSGSPEFHLRVGNNLSEICEPFSPCCYSETGVCNLLLLSESWDMYEYQISGAQFYGGRSQWPRCVRREHWDRGFEFHLKHGGLCAFLSCVCVVLCVGTGLATGWSPAQEVLPTVYGIKKLKKWPRSEKGH
jgi:hypothetical protein